VLGAVAGSFIAAILLRWPRGESALAGRSRCDSCGRTLGPVDLVPIVSFVALGGRCRTCRARIDRRHLAVELAAAAMGAVALVAHPLPLALATALFGWWLLLIALLDLEHHWLPDALTLPLIAAGLAAGALGLGPPLLDRAIGAAAGFAALYAIAALYRRARTGVRIAAAAPGCSASPPSSPCGCAGKRWRRPAGCRSAP
jgi:leader peptidase (prepilin peptidase) / N-methyltransferase